MKVHDQKRKSLSLFQSNYIQLQSVVSSSTLRKYTVQAVPSKKKALKKERGKENEMKIKRRRAERWKRGEKEQRGGKEEKKKKGMERVCAKGKEKGRMRCGKKEEMKEERMKEREKEKK